MTYFRELPVDLIILKWQYITSEGSDGNARQVAEGLILAEKELIEMFEKELLMRLEPFGSLLIRVCRC
jgi:hypothetical protein